MPTYENRIGPTHYEIIVAGQVSAERAGWFDGLTLSHRCTGNSRHVTILAGPVSDQASLFGILNRIRDLGLRLISVRVVQPTPNGPAGVPFAVEEER